MKIIEYLIDTIYDYSFIIKTTWKYIKLKLHIIKYENLSHNEIMEMISIGLL